MLEWEGRHLRHEMKHHLSPQQHRILRSRIAAVLPHDQYAGPDGTYHIRSLYFDDFRNTALFEKDAGVSMRKKYRIRIYDLSDRFIKLERKGKYGQYISKETVRLTRQEADQLIAGDVTRFLRSKKQLLREMYLEVRRNLLRPVVLVDYRREAFICPHGNVRICFDVGVRTAMGSTDLFNADAFTMPAYEEPGVILEIKFDNFLPKHIQCLFPDGIRPRGAIGKYVMCRKFTKSNDWEAQ